LKENLSRYIRSVQRGGEVQVVSRGRPVARLVGMRGTKLNDSEQRERLIAAGVLRAGEGDVSGALRASRPRIPGLDLSGGVTEERGDRV
jgi:prevent-host-death family protein